jgi:hypothetical protein
MILLFYEAQLLFTCHLGAQYTLILPKRKANITAQNAKFFAELRKEAEVFPLRTLRFYSVPFEVNYLPQRTLRLRRVTQRRRGIPFAPFAILLCALCG